MSTFEISKIKSALNNATHPRQVILHYLVTLIYAMDL